MTAKRLLILGVSGVVILTVAWHGCDGADVAGEPPHLVGFAPLGSGLDAVRTLVDRRGWVDRERPLTLSNRLVSVSVVRQE